MAEKHTWVMHESNKKTETKKIEKQEKYASMNVHVARLFRLVLYVWTSMISEYNWGEKFS